jgi:hypothetical protein
MGVNEMTCTLEEVQYDDQDREIEIEEEES